MFSHGFSGEEVLDLLAVPGVRKFFVLELREELSQQGTVLVK